MFIKKLYSRKKKEKVETPLLSVILLTWNRLNLTRTCFYSLMYTTKLPFELIIVDNNSTDGTREWLEQLQELYPQVKFLLLDDNFGGEALNMGVDLVDPETNFVVFSENDLEYLPDWDKQVVEKFKVFEDLGQLSLYAATPEYDKGEVWYEKPHEIEKRDGQAVGWTIGRGNVTTSSVLRKSLIDQGLEWTSLGNKSFLCPNDGKFSLDVKELGYKVAWSDKYLVFNWGHNYLEWKNNLDYYLQNYQSKSTKKLAGFERRLNENGYRLERKDGKIIDIVKDPTLIIARTEK